MVVYVSVNSVIDRNRITREYGSLEMRQSAKDMGRSLVALNRIAGNFERTAYDWAEWDETYAFAAKPSKAYLDANLNALGVKNIELNMVLVADTRGRVVGMRSIDLKTGRDRVLPGFTGANLGIEHPDLICRKSTDRVTGIYVCDGDPIIVVSHPILLSNGKGPVRGTLVMAREIDRKIIAQVSETVGLPVRIHPLSEIKERVRRALAEKSPYCVATSPTAIRGYAEVKGTKGQPVAVVSATMPRDIMAQGRQSVRSGSRSLVIMALLLAAILVFLLDRLVLSPLGALTREVSAIAAEGSPTGRVSGYGRGEVGQLASVFNRMLERREAVETAFRDSAERFEAIIENTPLVAIQGFDRDGVIQHWNPACESLYGYSRSDVVGKRLQDLILRESDVAGYEALIDEVWNTGMAAPAEEWTVNARSGDERHVYSTMFRVSGHGGQPEIFRMDIDITARNAAEAQLRESEERFRGLITGLPQPIFEIDLSATLTYANEASREMFGYTEEELAAGPHALQMIAPEEHDRIKAAIGNVLFGGQSINREYMGMRKNGEKFPMLIHAVAITWGGQPRGLRGIMVDMTERKRAEDALRRSELRFRDIAENMSDWIWEVDENCVYTFCSESVYKVLGYQVEEVLGKTPYDFMPPEDAASAREVVATAAAEKLPIHNFENWNITKDGRRVCMITNGVPVFDASDETIGFRGVDSDITERKEAEGAVEREMAKLSAMISGMEEGILFADAEGCVVEVNEYFGRLIGVPTVEIKGSSIIELHSPAMQGRIGELLRRFGNDPHSPPVTIELKLGDAEVLMRVQPIHHEDRYDGVLLNLIDVTELVEARREVERAKEEVVKRATEIDAARLAALNMMDDVQRAKDMLDAQNFELRAMYEQMEAHQVELQAQAAQLMAANAELEAANERIAQQQDEVVRASKLASLGTMAAGIAHEINNPLVAVAGYSEALIDKLATFTEAEFPYVDLFRRRLQIINDEAFRCKRITHGLLGFSREQGLSDVDTFDVRKALASAVELTHAHRLHSPETSARVDFGDEPLPIVGEHDKLIQVFLNLGMNAFDAMEIGQLLHITARRTDQRIEIVFRDEGCGMNDETMKRIFDPFFTTKEVGAGTGLGLAVAQSIVEASGGAIHVQSKVGVGTTVTVQFPIADVTEKAA